MLQKIAGLTGKYLKMEVNHETECTLAYHEQLVTRRVMLQKKWELNNDQPSREG
jgi:hypothetical protein